MNHNWKKLPYILKRIWLLGVAVLLVSAAFSIAVADDGPRIKPFTPPAGFDSGEDVDMSRRVAQHFDMVGEIFIMIPGEDRIVVYDASFNLAPGTRTAGFREGMYVGMKLNSQGEVISIERLNKNNLR